MVFNSLHKVFSLQLLQDAGVLMLLQLEGQWVTARCVKACFDTAASEKLSRNCRRRVFETEAMCAYRLMHCGQLHLESHEHPVIGEVVDWRDFLLVVLWTNCYAFSSSHQKQLELIRPKLLHSHTSQFWWFAFLLRCGINITSPRFSVGTVASSPPKKVKGDASEWSGFRAVRLPNNWCGFDLLCALWASEFQSIISSSLSPPRSPPTRVWTACKKTWRQSVFAILQPIQPCVATQIVLSYPHRQFLLTFNEIALNLGWKYLRMKSIVLMG